MKTERKAITLIELLIVIAILVMLAAIVIPQWSKSPAAIEDSPESTTQQTESDADPINVDGEQKTTTEATPIVQQETPSIDEVIACFTTAIEERKLLIKDLATALASTKELFLEAELSDDSDKEELELDSSLIQFVSEHFEFLKKIQEKEEEILKNLKELKAFAEEIPEPNASLKKIMERLPEDIEGFMRFIEQSLNNLE